MQIEIMGNYKPCVHIQYYFILSGSFINIYFSLKQNANLNVGISWY